MRYSKPHYYDEFVCVGGVCPDTCCAGWKIMIDEESLERYRRVKGEFGSRLLHEIDWEEGSFCQDEEKRCAFLNREKLCDLYSALGEEALCRTCTDYPRHTEEFEGLRELSLSLSCPIAARRILFEEAELLTEETQEEEELSEEFEDFDLLLFTQLEDARAVVLKLLKDREVPVEERMAGALFLAERMQECVNEERFFELEQVIGEFEKTVREGRTDSFPRERRGQSRYQKRCEEYALLVSLERLREEWSQVLAGVCETLYEKGEESYQELCEQFEAYLRSDSGRSADWAAMTENLLVFFVYLYFCGAVYDDWIYSKMALCVFSVQWIRELCMWRWAAGDGALTRESCTELAWRYAREIEHSDENLVRLEEWLMGKVFELSEEE